MQRVVAATGKRFCARGVPLSSTVRYTSSTAACQVPWRSHRSQHGANTRSHGNTSSHGNNSSSYHSNTNSHSNDSGYRFAACCGVVGLVAASTAAAPDEELQAEQRPEEELKTGVQPEQNVVACSAAPDEELQPESELSLELKPEVQPEQSAVCNYKAEDPPAEELAVLDKIYMDILYTEEKNFELLELALGKYEGLRSAEIYWRRARCQWELVHLNKKGSPYTGISVAFGLVEMALDVDDTNSDAHRWMAIISNGLAQAQGIKHQLQNLPNMKEHLLRAVELNPRDTTALTLLGQWALELKDMAWWQRKIVNALFGGVPHSTYEEVVEYCSRAEEIAPGSWSRNLLLLGKAYTRLGDRRQGRMYIEKAIERPVHTRDDQVVSDQAVEFYQREFRGPS